MFNFEEIEYMERLVFEKVGDVKIFKNFENLTNLEKIILTALVENSFDELVNLFKIGIIDKVGFVNDAEFITEVLRKLK